MKLTEPTSKPYKKLLLEARRLRTATGTNAYRLAVILCRVFEDTDFRADNGNADDLKLCRILDDYCQPLTLEFIELKAVLAKFPNEADWKDGKLRRMYDTTVQHVKTSQKQATRVVEDNGAVHCASPRRIELTTKPSAKQCMGCVRLQAINDRLLAENRQLRQDNAQLRSQLEESQVGAMA